MRTSCETHSVSFPYSGTFRSQKTRPDFFRFLRIASGGGARPPFFLIMARVLYTVAASIRVEVIYMLLLLLIGLYNRAIWALTILIFFVFALIEWWRYEFRFEHVGADGVSTHGSDDRGNKKSIQRTPLRIMVVEVVFMVCLTWESEYHLFFFGWWWVWVIKPVCITMLVVYLGTLHSPFQRIKSWWEWLLLRYIEFALLSASHLRYTEQVLICSISSCIGRKFRSYCNRAFRSILFGNALLHAQGPRQRRWFTTLW